MSTKKAIFGLILILIGLLLLGRSMDFFYFDFGDFIRVLLPVGFIVLGAWLILRRRREELTRESEPYVQHSGPPPPPPPVDRPTMSGEASGESHSGQAGVRVDTGPRTDREHTGPTTAEPGRVKFDKSFGDMYIDCNGVSLQNIQISSVFGDVEVRVHGGKLESGLNRMVISGFLGDIRIILPVDMPVLAHVSSFGGDVEALGHRESGFGNNVDAQTANYQSAEDRLFIAVNTFLGDVQIYQAS
jgi:lia operon protein LiaF